MKRLIALFISCLMLVSVLAGCGGKDKKAGSMVDGKYVPGDDLTIELWYTQGSDFVQANPVKDDVVSKWLYDKTKVNVATIYGNDNGQWDTKLSRLVAGDNLPHIIACGAGQGPAHFAKLAKSKLIWEITDEMLEKYAPNYLRRVPKSTIDQFRIDGKLYGLPYEQPSSKATNPEMDDETLGKIDEYIRGIGHDEHFALWIRDDVLKKIYPEAKSWEEIEKIAASTGAPVADITFDIPITTKEEYIDFFYKIKELGLTAKNGNPVYAFGYPGGDNWAALNYIGGDMMGYSPYYYTSAWIEDTEEMIIPLVTEECKEAAKIQNKMVRDEVIDPESLVHTTDMFSEKLLNGQYAVCAVGYSVGAQQMNNILKEQGASYRIRPFNVNIPNMDKYTPGKSSSTFSTSLCFTNVVTEDELIQLLNWVNICCSEEFEEVYWWGTPEDGLYTEKDGVRTYVDDRFNKRFIDGDTGALDDKETRGIGGDESTTGLWYVNAVNLKQSAFAPSIYNKTFKLPVYTAVAKITADSPHAVTNIIPPRDVWHSDYASIPEVVDYWAQREKWENAFKITFTATSDKDFEKKWQEAVNTLNSIVDVKAMEKAMTKVARETRKKTKQ